MARAMKDTKKMKKIFFFIGFVAVLLFGCIN